MRICSNIQYLLLFVFLSLSGCEGCGKREFSLAKLIQTRGNIERDYSSSIGKWQSAPVGDRFTIGDGVRAKRQSNAQLELNNGSLFNLASGTQVRFLKHLHQLNDAKIDVEIGETEVLVGEQALRLEFGQALAVFDPNSKANIKREKDSLHFKIDFGKAKFFANPEGKGTAKEVRSGGNVTLTLGKLRIVVSDNNPTTSPGETQDKKEKTPIQSSVAPPSNTISTDRSSDAEQIMDGLSTQVTKADFEARAGGSFTVHAPSPPVAIAFRTAELCPEGAILTVRKKGKWFGEGSTTGMFTTGRNVYRIFCRGDDVRKIKNAKKTGVIFVQRDSGTLSVPGSPPSSFVDTDGRSYKVSYQNLLPTITVRWSEAPEAKQYQLKIQSRNKTRTFTSEEPSMVLRSGALEEGRHKLRFQSVGKRPRFAQTTNVEIVFNNAAPKANIAKPQNGSFAPGSMVTVEGVAAKDWEVIAEYEALHVDKHRRFFGEIAYSGQFKAIAIQLKHPSKGVHYYLRRSKQYAK